MGERDAQDRGVPQAEDGSGTRRVEPRRAVREAIAELSRDPDAILRAALGRAGLRVLPSRPSELARFVSDVLVPEVRRSVGVDAASSLRKKLEPMLRAFESVARSTKQARTTPARTSVLVTRDEAVMQAVERRLDLRTIVVSGALALRSALVGAHPAGVPFVVIDGATEDALAIAVAVPELEGIGALVWRASPDGVQRWRGSPSLGSRLLATTDASTAELVERLRRAQGSE